MTTNMENTRISITPLFINYTPNTYPYSHYNNTNINNNTQTNTNKQITIMLKQKRITISTNY